MAAARGVDDVLDLGRQLPRRDQDQGGGMATLAAAGQGLADSRDRTASPKASVFPEPVGAMPHTSRPASASGRVAAWIGKGRSIPLFSRAGSRALGHAEVREPGRRESRGKGGHKTPIGQGRRWPTRCDVSWARPAPMSAGRRGANARGIEVQHSGHSGDATEHRSSTSSVACADIVGTPPRHVGEVRRTASEHSSARTLQSGSRGTGAIAQASACRRPRRTCSACTSATSAAPPVDEGRRGPVWPRLAAAGRDARAELATGQEVRLARARELRRAVRTGEQADRDLHQRQSPPRGVDRQEVPGLRACRCSTWCRRATSGSSTRSRSSTGGRASSSPPTPPGGSARPSARGHRRRQPDHPSPATRSVSFSIRSCRPGPVSKPNTAATSASTRSPPTSRSAPDRVAEILRHAAAPASLSEPMGHDGTAELGELVEDHSAVSPFDSAATALSAGRGRQDAGRSRRARTRDPAAQIRHRPRHGRARSRRSVSRFGLTRERIRQIEAKAMAKLRHPDGGPTTLSC